MQTIPNRIAQQHNQLIGWRFVLLPFSGTKKCSNSFFICISIKVNKKGTPEGGTCSFRSVMTKIEGNAPIKNSKGNISGNLQFSQRNNHLIINILFLNKLTLKGRLGTDFINGFLPPNLQNRLVKHVLLFLLSNDNYRLYSPNNAEVPFNHNCLYNCNWSYYNTSCFCYTTDLRKHN